jgi:phosphoribosylanthranilate isomerase
MTRIKICGVTLPDDAARVASAGVDFIGLNFWEKSKRYVDPARAPMLSSVVRATGAAKLVGIFVKRVSLAVFRPVWKALAVTSQADIAHLDVWPAEAILLDAPTPGRGGAGATFDWALAHEARERFPRLNIVLAGGLTADTVMAAIAQVEPWAVDVASGVEAGPGIKDPAKLEAFLAAVRTTAPR